MLSKLRIPPVSHLPHSSHLPHRSAQPARASNLATYPAAYTRSRPDVIQPPVNSPNPRHGSTPSADFQALRSSYRTLTPGGHKPVHFVCNGNNATITKSRWSNQFVISGRVTSQPFNPRAKDDTVSIGPSGVSGRNGNTGKPLTHDEQQMLIQAAKFALGNGYVRSTPFPPDVRFNGI